MKRLLLDQGCPRSTAAILNNQGWQVLHVGDVGLSRATDTAILEHAHADNRVCVTLDADFHAILAVSGAVRPSTVRIRIEGLDADALAALLVRAWPHVEADLEQGRIGDHRLDLDSGAAPAHPARRLGWGLREHVFTTHPIRPPAG